MPKKVEVTWDDNLREAYRTHVDASLRQKARVTGERAPVYLNREQLARMTSSEIRQVLGIEP